MFTQRGFTLLELLITVTIAAILLAIAAPSFNTMIGNYRVSTEANKLLAAVQESRTEAVKRARYVTVCRLVGTDCVATSTAPLVSFIDTATSDTTTPVYNAANRLRQWDGANANLTIASTNATFLRFNARGLVANNTASATVDIRPNNCTDASVRKQRITVSAAGQISLSKIACNAN